MLTIIPEWLLEREAAILQADKDGADFNYTDRTNIAQAMSKQATVASYLCKLFPCKLFPCKLLRLIGIGQRFAQPNRAFAKAFAQVFECLPEPFFFLVGGIPER